MILPYGTNKEEIYVDDRIILFAIQMQKEMDDNSHKGCTFEWARNSSFSDWLYEFEYHKSKLIAALMSEKNDLKYEFCADLGNYLAALYFKSNIEIQKSFTLTENPETKII